MIHGPNPMGGFPHGDTAKFPRVSFGVDDLEAATARIRELGGTAGEAVTIPAGRFANCVDDQGVGFSIFQAADA
ncbi:MULTISPECIES: hypothetical protein [unclassified Streptomyces]|uniref:hypothetical protein n=1 Tax=unclassified Streptomyces TaxID=2593676 RepID=UPI00278BE3AE|nr:MULTISPECIES: hypothetical protein [unclassified Streptomyces]